VRRTVPGRLRAAVTGNARSATVEGRAHGEQSVMIDDIAADRRR